MDTGRITWALATVCALALGAPQGAQAQLDDLTVTAHTGIVFGTGTLSDYTELGPSAGLRVEYPLMDRLGLLADLDLDYLNGDRSYGIPDLKLWRYQAGVVADVLGGESDGWALRAHIAGGATTFRSHEFFRPNDSASLRFKHTYFTGSGGIELAFGLDSPIGAYVGATANWAPVDEGDTQILRDAALGPLDSLDSALTVPLTIGLRLRVL